MSVLTLRLTLELDGVPVLGTPIVRRVSADELQSFDVELASAGNTTTWTALQASQIDTLTFLCVRPSHNVTFRLDDQSDAAGRATLPVNAGGLLLLLNTEIDSGAGSSNARCNNNSGATATLRGVIGGT